MYKIFHSKQYNKSIKKIIKSGRYDKSLVDVIDNLINTIARGEKLDAKYEDHQLHGKVSQYRECHIKSDLLLVYELNKQELVLLTIDIGSHS